MTSATFNHYFGYGQVKRLTKTKTPHPREGDDSLSNDQLVGIEVEVEGITRNIPPLKYWEMIEDGSLRDGGFEFRTQAFPATFLRPILVELYTALRDSNPTHYFSERSSVHFHFDFREKTPLDLVRLHLLYGVTEPCLFRFGSPERMKSTFCVPLRDSVDIPQFQKIYQAFKKNGNTFPHVASVVDFISKVCPGKYSAMNLLNLQNHNQRNDDDGRGRASHTGCGSVEFRQLQGTPDVEKVITWGGALARLIQSSQELDLEEIERSICHLNSTSEYSRFLEAVFKKSWKDIIPVPYNHKIFSEGVSFAKVLIGGKDRKATAVGDFITSPLIYALQQRISGDKKKQESPISIDAPVPDALHLGGIDGELADIANAYAPLEQVEVENPNPQNDPAGIQRPEEPFEEYIIRMRENLNRVAAGGRR